jgi:hypothetical protein
MAQDWPSNDDPSLYTPMASPGAFPSAWFQPDIAMRAAGILPQQPMPVSDLSEMGPMQYTPGGRLPPPVAPGQDLMSQVLMPGNEQEMRRVAMLRALGLPPAPQATPPTFEMPPAVVGMNLQRPAGAPQPPMPGAGPIMPTIPPSPSLDMGPYAPQGYAGQIQQQLASPFYPGPGSEIGAFFAGLQSGGLHPNPVVAQIQAERDARTKALLELQQQWQINEGQVSTAQTAKMQAALKAQELAQNQTNQRGVLIKDIAGQFWSKAETPEQRQFAADMSQRAAEVAGIPLPASITDAWKAGATTPAKNAQALAEVIAGSPVAEVASRTGVPVPTLRSLESLYQRSKQGDTSASQAIHYATGLDPQAAAKTAGEIQAQGQLLAKSQLEQMNMLAGPQQLPGDFLTFVNKYGGWAKLVADPKLMKSVVDEYWLQKEKDAGIAAGMGVISPEAANQIQLLGRAANAAVDLAKQVETNPHLVEQYAGLTGVGGAKKWIAQKFAGQKPTEEQYKLAAMDFAANELKALAARLLAGAAMGPNEMALYSQITPDFGAMNAAQFRISVKYTEQMFPILYEQAIAMQSLGAKQAMANGTFSQYKLGVARQYPLPSISKIMEELQAAGQMQLPKGFKEVR